MPKLPRLLPRLTYANVTSTLALVLALSGGAAYAAHEFIDSSDVADESLTGDDIRGRLADPGAQQPFVDGTLTTEDIRNGSLFPIDIADNSISGDKILTIGGTDISPGSISGGHVQGDTLNGGHVANDSLDGFDVTNLSGADLIDGTVGRDDLAAAARGFATTFQRTSERRVERGDRFSVLATCPSDSRVVGGGFSHNESRHPDDIAVSAATRYNNRAWVFQGRHVGGPGSGDIEVRVLAVCAR